MKIWIKLLIGIVIGALITIFFPGVWEVIVYNELPRLFINIGRYTVFPLVLFSLVYGTYELKQEKKLFEVYGQLFMHLILSALLLVLIGVLSIFLFSPDRIHFPTEEAIEAHHVLGLNETITMAFPRNFFAALVGNGSFLLPVVVLAIIFGSNLSFDKMVTRPVVQLVDSLSRIFYHMTSLIIEIFWIAIIAITAATLFNVKIILETPMFRQLLLILGIDMVVVLFGIFPGLLYLLGERKNPYKWLYAIAAPLLTALISGDHYLCLGMLTKHGKENLGVPRQINSAVYPIFAIFGRAGTALVTSVTFILILKSYQSHIPFIDILQIIGSSFLVSFTLGSVPGLGAFVSISLLCTIYGKGLQDMYLILKPISILLVCIGVVMDVATAAFASVLITHGRKPREVKAAANFI